MKAYRLDLEEVKNPNCRRCKRQERKEVIDDGVCDEAVSVVDGLPVRCVGEWAYEKIYRLLRYFAIFTQGMKNRWSGLNYLEICSGPGRCIRRTEGVEMDGTASAIIKHPIFRLLQKAVFIDINKTVLDTLNKRITAANAEDKAEAIEGSYHKPDRIRQIVDGLPKQCLTLCFIDPTECDIPFQTIAEIHGGLKKVDFIINAALGTDVTRNIGNAVLDSAFITAKKKYETFLGSAGFCDREDVKKASQFEKHSELRKLFVNEYVSQFEKLGFLHSDPVPVRHYYYLLFFSTNGKGIEFWNKACEIGPDNQRQLMLN